MSKVVKSFHTLVSPQSRTLTIPVIRLVSASPISERLVAAEGKEPEILDDADTQQIAQDLVENARQAAEELLAAARLQAEQLISDANGESARQLAQADMQVSQIIADAKASGYEAGYAEGKTAAEMDYQQTIDHALELLRSIQDEKQQYYVQAEQELVTLACSIASDIMMRELELEGSWVASTVQQALSELIDPGKVEIHANAHDIPLLAERRHELQAQLNGRPDLQFIPDSSVAKGGCVVRSKHGAVDASVETQLNEVKRTLLNIAANL